MIESRQIDKCVERIFDEIKFTAEPAGLYDPLRYMIGIGGKRIRPRLCLTAYSLFKNAIEDDIVEPAAALEVFHTFTLIHDDIMDRSPLRRGHETVWKKWNEDTAILSGDVMLIDAYMRIAKTPQPSHAAVMELFSKTAAEVCEGQQYDMEFETSETIPMDAYNKMIGLKTAVLLACSAKIGALVAGAPEESCEALYRYGYELGMAFQIADDWLDAYGDEGVFGKPIGGDILNGKKSWLTIRALEKTQDRRAFLAAFEAPAETPEQKKEKIAAVKALYEELGVSQDALAQIRVHSELAIAAVSGLNVDVEPLRAFADSLIGRVK